MDLIRYIETAALTQVLDTIHQLTGQPLLTQILGYGNIQSDCQATFISDQPTRDILRDDLYICTLQNGLLSIYHQGKRSGFLESVDIFLAHRLNRGGQRLHDLSVARAQLLKVRFDLLHQDTCRIIHELQLLHVHLVQDQVLHSLDTLLLMSVYNRNHYRMQRLANLDIHLAAKSQYHRRNILSHLHTLFQILVDLRLVVNREIGQVYGLNVLTSRNSDQVQE